MQKKIWLGICGVYFCQKYFSQSILALALALGCLAAQAGDVQLYAAASLTDVMTELSHTYQKANPGVTIKKSFAGSSILARQIEKGAPADIFISADNDWLNHLQKRGLVDSQSRKTLFSNDLVMIAPAASKVQVVLDPAFDFNTSFSGHLCTGDTASVPVGRYAKQSLSSYGWWEKIASRVVGTEDVRTALAFVERAECSLGIVYKTDAKLTKKVKVIATFPATSHAPIEYPGALTKNAGTEARAFWIFLQSDAAKAVFANYGFTLLE